MKIQKYKQYLIYTKKVSPYSHYLRFPCQTDIARVEMPPQIGMLSSANRPPLRANPERRQSEGRANPHCPVALSQIESKNSFHHKSLKGTQSIGGGATPALTTPITKALKGRHTEFLPLSVAPSGLWLSISAKQGFTPMPVFCRPLGDFSSLT